jgi:hypothetical protein
MRNALDIQEPLLNVLVGLTVLHTVMNWTGPANRGGELGRINDAWS